MKSRSDHDEKKIPVHVLADRDEAPFNFKLYYLKGSYSAHRQLPSMPGKTEVPHRHRYHEICFFSKGEGIHEIDFEKKKIEEHSIHFVGAGQVHLLTSSKDITGRVLAFSPEFLWEEDAERQNAFHQYPFFNPFNPVQTIRPDREDFLSVMQSVESLAEDIESWERRSTPVIRSHLRIILDKCHYLASRETRKRSQAFPTEDDVVTRYKQLVELHFRKKHQVQDYSDALNITPNHLNRCCKEATGHTASDILSQRIVLEAQRLLLFTGLSSKAIAYELGFEDPSYFSRVFRQKSGHSPLSFRKFMREKYH